MPKGNRKGGKEEQRNVGKDVVPVLWDSKSGSFAWPLF